MLPLALGWALMGHRDARRRRSRERAQQERLYGHSIPACVVHHEHERGEALACTLWGGPGLRVKEAVADSASSPTPATNSISSGVSEELALPTMAIVSSEPVPNCHTALPRASGSSAPEGKSSSRMRNGPSSAAAPPPSGLRTNHGPAASLPDRIETMGT
eukprot:scaffold99423_cov28-Tisochrysis_lutea.AAC.5